jgi:hypothetical protein
MRAGHERFQSYRLLRFYGMAEAARMHKMAAPGRLGAVAA